MTGVMASEDGVLPKFIVIRPPIPNPAPHYRGAVLVDGERILDREPYENWLVGSSADHQEKKDADRVAIQMFGMSISKRLSTGACNGLSTADSALDRLADMVHYDHRLAGYMQDLARRDVPSLPRVSTPYGRLVCSLQEYTTTADHMILIRVVGAIWELANSVPSKQRGDVYPILARMLAVMGLHRDAMALMSSSLN